MDLWFQNVPVERLRNDLVKLGEAMGEGEVYHDFQMLMETMLIARDEVGRKGVSLDRLKYLFFGPKTESFAAVCKQAMDSQAGRPKEKREKPKGHGRNGADDFPKAKRVPVALDGKASGEPCPHCPNGKVYPLSPPRYCALSAWLRSRRRSTNWSGAVAISAVRCSPPPHRRVWARRSTTSASPCCWPCCATGPACP